MNGSVYEKGRAWIEVDMSGLGHNLQLFQRLLPERCALMPAVKANAYGHGAVLVAKELERLGVHDFCVAGAAEGVRKSLPPPERKAERKSWFRALR